MIRKPAIEQRYYYTSTMHFAAVSDRLVQPSDIEIALNPTDEAVRAIKNRVRMLNRAWLALPEAERTATINATAWWLQ